MDFKTATDELFDGVTHKDFAKALGVSVATIRQARLSAAAKASRSPPDGWERAVVKMAKQRADRLNRLVESLRRA